MLNVHSQTSFLLLPLKQMHIYVHDTLCCTAVVVEILYMYVRLCVCIHAGKSKNDINRVVEYHSRSCLRDYDSPLLILLYIHTHTWLDTLSLSYFIFFICTCTLVHVASSLAFVLSLSKRIRLRSCMSLPQRSSSELT